MVLLVLWDLWMPQEHQVPYEKGGQSKSIKAVA